MATLQGKAVKNTYRQVLQIGANNVGVSGTLQPVQDGAGNNTALSLSTLAATVNGDLTITGDLIITGGGIQIQDLIDDTVATLIQNGTGITWAYNDTARTLTPTITIATADGGVQGDYLQLNTNANEASAVGKLKWNTTDGTLDIGLMGGQVVLQVGQEQVARVLNNSGSILTEAGYQAVKISSAQGQRLAVTLAQANNEANSTDTLGLVTENIANNQEGFVTTSGLVRQIDTTGDLQSEVWVDGDILYLSPTVPGGVTKVKPLAPQQTVIVGFVVYAHKTQGKIYVKVDNGYEISELHDVRITSVANNNILKYNSSLSVWENVAGTTTNIAEGTNLYYTQARFDSAFAAKTTTNLAEGTNLYFTTARGDANFATNFATKTTTNLPEGTNLYFTNARSRGALSVTAGTGISYNSSTGNFELSAIPNASLANDDVTINGSAVALGGSLTLTTSDIAEGTNLYWTNARFDSRFSTKTTTDLAEGTNLYYTQARFNTAFSAKSTTDLAEGTNLYYTDARARAAFSENAVGLDYSAGSGVLSLTSGYAIPTTVKLGEYDTAYNRSIVSAAVTGTSTKTLTLTEQDASTITATWTDQGITTINGTANQIATSTVGNTTTVGFTNDVTFPNNVVVSGNLTINGTATYVNTQSISSKDPLFEVANDNNTTDAVDIGYYGRYYDSAQTRVEFTGLFRDASDAGKYKIFSGLIDEPTNVVDTTGTGYTVGTLVANVEGNLAGTANAANVLSTARSISATGDAAWTVSFDGSANATAALTLANTGVTATTYGTSTSVPTIAVDGKGRITSASNTNIAFPVTTVNGFSGTVVLTTSNIAEGTNQYFTSARAQAAISGTAPISVASGVVSISQSSSINNGYLSSTDWNTFNSKSPAAGSTSITTLGTITTGVWNATSLSDTYIASASTWNAKIGGSGTSQYIPKFGVSNTIGNSVLLIGSNNTVSTVFSSASGSQSIAGMFTGQGSSTYTGSMYFGAGEPNGADPSYPNIRAGLKVYQSWNGSGTDVKFDLFTLQSGVGNNTVMTGNANGSATFSSSIQANNAILTSGGTERYLQLLGYNNSYATIRSNVGFNSSYNNLSFLLNFNANDSGQGNTAIPSWQMNLGGNESNADSFSLSRSSAGSFTFSTLFKVQGNGNVGIGTADIVDKFVVAASNATSAIRYLNAGTVGSPVTSALYFRDFNTGGGMIRAGLVLQDQSFDTSGINMYLKIMLDNASFVNVISMLRNGSVINYNNSTTWQQTSDIRIKENIRPINNALDKLCALNPTHFEFKNNKGETRTGFIAQEFEKIFAGHTSEIDPTEEYAQYFEEGEKMKSIDADLIPYLVKAIQELKAEIDILKAK